MGLAARFQKLSIALLVVSSAAAQSAIAEENVCAGYSVEPAIRRNSSGEIVSVDPAKLDPALLATYQQQEYSLEDPMGDYALGYMGQQTFAKIWWTLRGKQEKIERSWHAMEAAGPCASLLFKIHPVPSRIEQEPNVSWNPSPEEEGAISVLEAGATTKEQLLKELRSGALYLEGHRNPILVQNVQKALIQVMKEEFQQSGLRPKLGTVHRWSSAFLKKYRLKFGAISPFSKVLVALSRGETGKYMVTGKEAALIDFILDHPLHSITLDELFRGSYRLNQGDVYLTLLTIENIYALHWRTPNRDTLNITQRLKPIIHTFGKRGDEFGAWYHLFGMMLYGYAKNSIFAGVVGETETLGSHILGHFEDEKQEDYVNAKGGRIGALLRSAVKKNAYLKAGDHPEYVDPSFYLAPAESFTERLQKLADSREQVSDESSDEEPESEDSGTLHQNDSLLTDEVRAQLSGG